MTTKSERNRVANALGITAAGADLVFGVWRDTSITEDQKYAAIVRIRKDHSNYDPFEPALTTADGRHRSPR
jgi:hypothetical protein